MKVSVGQSMVVFYTETPYPPIAARVTEINFFGFLSGLSKQSMLTWLSLAGNQLTTLDTGMLEKLPRLRYLSVENNAISHLRGLQVFIVLSSLKDTSRLAIYFKKALKKLEFLEKMKPKILNSVIFNLSFFPELSEPPGVLHRKQHTGEHTRGLQSQGKKGMETFLW